MSASKSHRLDATWIDFSRPLESLRRRLFQYADSGYRDFLASTLPPSSRDLIGVRAAGIRQTLKELLSIDGSAFLESIIFPDRSTVRRSSDKKLTLFYGEERLTVSYLLDRVPIEIDRRIEAFSAFQPYVNSWYVCDGLCQECKPQAHELVKLWEYVGSCFQSSHEYTQRFALVMSLNNFISDAYVENTLTRVDQLFHKGIASYTVSMGAAWLLCEIFIQHESIARRFFHHNALDVATYNRALQKICESNRVAKETKSEIRSLKRGKSRSGVEV